MRPPTRASPDEPTVARAPLRVLQVTGRADHGGGPEHILQLLEAFGPGVEAWVAAPADGVYVSRYRQRLGDDRLLAVPARRFSMSTVAMLAREIRRRGIAVVHSHGTAAGLLARPAARLAGVPCVHTFHGVSRDASPRSRLLQEAERFLARWTAQSVAVSPGERDLVLSLGLCDPARLSTVCNGIAPGAPSLPAPRTRDGRLRVVSFLRANEQKHPERAFEVVRRAAASGLVLDAVFYGEGMTEFAAGMGAEATTVAAPSTLRVCPPTDEPLAALAAADVYLSTSRWEGLPYALLEAASVGAVVVATDVVGNRDVVRQEETGLLVAEGSADEAVRALARLADDAALLARLCEAAFARVRAEFDRVATARRLEEIYRSVMSDGTGRG
jgi:glycosyltransferase involved in cell wall biosynthesis